MSDLDSETKKLLLSLGIDLGGAIDSKKHLPDPSYQEKTLKNSGMKYRWIGAWLLLILCGGLILFGFRSSLKKERYERQLVAIEDSMNLVSLSPSSSIVSWKEPMENGFFSKQYRGEHSFKEYTNFLDEYRQREKILANRVELVRKILDIIQNDFHPDMLMALHQSVKSTIQADLVTGAKLAASASNAFSHQEKGSFQEVEFESCASVGLTEEVIAKYITIADSVEDIRRMVDQTVELLEDGGGDLVFIGETLEEAMAQIEMIEMNSDNPTNFLILAMLDMPKLKERLFTGARIAVDLIFDQTLAQADDHKEIGIEQIQAMREESLKEIQAIGLLRNRLPLQGDKTRLEAFEALYELRLDPFKNCAPKSIVLESWKSDFFYETSQSIGVMIESIHYPKDSVL